MADNGWAGVKISLKKEKKFGFFLPLPFPGKEFCCLFFFNLFSADFITEKSPDFPDKLKFFFDGSALINTRV